MVEFLYWEGCPSHPEALLLLHEVLAELDRDDEIQIVEVLSEEDARRLAFPGSPTIRVDGADIVDPGDEPAALTCRVFHRRDGRVSPTPDPDDVRDALRQALTRRSP